MEVTTTKRVFIVDDKEIQDPDPQMNLAQVKIVLSQQYPEMINAVFSAPEITGDKLIYKSEKKVGSKG